MRAVGLDFEARRPVERDVAEPAEPVTGEVLLETLEIGICGTDRELTRFRFGAPPEGDSFLILGHELLAQVATPGGGLRKGDYVVPVVRRPCPQHCPACSAGRPDLCQTGHYYERGINRLHGYLTERVVDRAVDLAVVPAALVDVAVLAEPLSVVEKALETALRLHPLEPRSAIVTGAGPVGLLTAFALLVRGFEVTVVSLEADDHPRAALLRAAGARYLSRQRPAPADLVFEASGGTTGSAEWLKPLGVLLLIGAAEGDVKLPTFRMILENLSVAGTVNAAHCHFEAALTDLARWPRPWLAGFVERRAFSRWAETLERPSTAPKLSLCG